MVVHVERKYRGRTDEQIRHEKTTKINVHHYEPNPAITSLVSLFQMAGEYKRAEGVQVECKQIRFTIETSHPRLFLPEMAWDLAPGA